MFKGIWQALSIWIFFISFNLVHTQEQLFSLKKTIQMPGNRQPTSFAIRSDDEILALTYMNKNSSLPKISNSNFSFFTGQTYNRLVHSYDYDKRQVTHSSVSDSGIYTVQGKSIIKYPFLYQREAKLGFPTGNIVSIDDKRKVISIYNISSNCSTINLVSAFDSNIKPFVLEKNSTQCIQEEPGYLQDLKIGMIALKSKYCVYIIGKRDLNNVIQKINISGSSNSTLKILAIGSFYHTIQNFSMIFLQVGLYSNYSTYVWNHKTQQYEISSQFYHPATKCQLYDMDTCLSLFEDKLLINTNIQKLTVKTAYSPKENPFENMSILAVSDDSRLIAGYYSYGHGIKIFSINEQNMTFSLIKDITLHRDYLSCIKKGIFISDSKQLLLQITPCNYHKIDTVCKLKPQSEEIYCVLDQVSEIKYNHTGFALVNASLSNFLYEVSVKWIYDGHSFFVEVRQLNNTLNVLYILPVYLDQENDKLKRVKILNNAIWGRKVAVLIQTEQGQTAINFLISNQGIQKLNSQIMNIPFELTQVFQEYMVSLRQISAQNKQCVLQFYDQTFTLFKSSQYHYKNCTNPQSQYRLITRENYQYVIIEPIPSNESRHAYLTDFYRIQIHSQGPTVLYNSMFINNFNDIFNWPTLNTYFIMHKQKILVDFQYSQVSDTMPFIMIYNVSSIPIYFYQFMPNTTIQRNFSIKDNQFPHKFAYISPLSTKELVDQVFTWTTANYLRVIHSPRYRWNSLYVPVTIFKIYNPKNQQVIISQSRTFIAQTGKHAISIMDVYGNYSVVCFTQITYKTTGNVIWTLDQQQGNISSATFSRQGYTFLAKLNSVKLEAFNFVDEAQDYIPVQNFPVFDNVFTDNNDNLIITVSIENMLRYQYFKESPLSRQYLHFYDLVSIDSEFNYKLSNRNQIIIEQNKTSITRRNLTGNNKDNFIYIEKSSISSLKFVDLNYIQKTIENDHSGLLGQREVKVQTSQQTSDKFQLLKSTKIHEQYIYPSTATLNNAKLTDKIICQQTIILRFEDQTYFYSPNLIDHYIVKQITGNTIFAVSEFGGLVAYVNCIDNVQTIFVLRINSYNHHTKLQTIQLPALPYVQNPDKYYNPKIKQLQFSSSNTLIVLTQPFDPNLSSQPSQEYFQVLYFLTQQPCNEQQSVFDNNQCKCRLNYTTHPVSTNDSKIFVKNLCKCDDYFYFDDQQKKCLCPASFTYDPNNGGCSCPSDSIAWSPQTIQYYCHSHTKGWLVWVIIGPIVSFVVIVVFCCFCCRKLGQMAKKSRKTRIQICIQKLKKCKLICINKDVDIDKTQLIRASGGQYSSGSSQIKPRTLERQSPDNSFIQERNKIINKKTKSSIISSKEFLSKVQEPTQQKLITKPKSTTKSVNKFKE